MLAKITSHTYTTVYNGEGFNMSDFRCCFSLTLCSFLGQLQPFCDEPADRGPCNKLELRYRFNEDSEYCDTFLYGGCGGNKNNFRTVGECVKACVDGKNAFAYTYMT